MQSGKFVGRSLAQRLAAPRELPLPSSHLGLSWRPLRSEDMAAVRDLLEESADPGLGDELCVVSLLTPWAAGERAECPQLDCLTGWDTAGTLQAFGTVTVNPNSLTEVQADVFGVVRPQWRGRGVGRALLEWQDGRARQLMLCHGADLPASIRTWVRTQNMGRRRLLAAGGFSPQSRWTFMDLDLNPEVRELAVAARVRLAERGMDLRSFGESNGEEVRRLHNRVSMVMERRQPLGAPEWDERLASVNTDLSAILTDGTNLVGYSLATDSENGSCLRIAYYGIDRGFRYQGNGTDLILSHIDAALDAGYRRMSVPVVSESAPSFLTRHGFFEGDSQILYTIDI